MNQSVVFMTKRTFCNPVDINYQYQPYFRGRESADPAVVLFKGAYYLFASHGGGYWRSDDLVNWSFIEVDLQKQPQFARFAPATMVLGDRLYVAHSEGGNMLYSENPADPDSWVNLGRAFFWNDPALFLDDDGKVYLYDGLSPEAPLRVARLDPDNGMALLEGPVGIFQSDKDRRGFERRGDENEINDMNPHLEGSWMYKANGRYYLTYAVPGTEYAAYCDGCAAADSPMGPFTYCDNSPVVYKATGFLRGCGHGCLFADKNGKLWKMDTVSVSVNHIFERRLCLFPAKIGTDGRLYTNTLRGDYPMHYPHEVSEPFSAADAGLHLLSYGKKVSASSVLDASHAPEKAADENMKTWWSAKSGDAGEWLSLDLGSICEVQALQVNFADQDTAPATGRHNSFAYRFMAEASADGIHWKTLIDRRENDDDKPHEYFALPAPQKLRFFRLTNAGQVPANGRFAVSGLRVFGTGSGPAPEKAPVFTAARCADEREMRVTWKTVPGAEGYFIRFGVNKDELHTHWQVIGKTEATVRCLTAGVRYYVRVDAYNENGIAEGSGIQTV